LVAPFGTLLAVDKETTNCSKLEFARVLIKVGRHMMMRGRRGCKQLINVG